MDADTARSHRGSLPHGEVTEFVIGAFYDVYNELGAGFLESVYAGALARTSEDAGVGFVREPALRVRFRGATVGLFKPDFVVANAVIGECKAARALDEMHRAQVLNYLKASAYEVGLLLNFGQRPTFERLVLSRRR